MRNAKRWVLIGCLAALGTIPTGCIIRDAYYFIKPEGPPKYEEIAKTYQQTKLKSSTAADVLPLMYMPEYSLLSQSTKVLAAAGSKKGGYKSWFTMVAFDEDDLLARRKYLMVVDEKPKVLWLWPWPGLSFDCLIEVDSEVLEEPYSDENARRIAVLKFVQQSVQDDIMEVSSDNKAFVTSGAMINQALEAVLNDLAASPALARRLSDPKGLSFEHVSFDKGKIQMLIEQDITAVRMRLGSFAGSFKGIEDIDEAPAPTLIE